MHPEPLIQGGFEVDAAEEPLVIRRGNRRNCLIGISILRGIARPNVEENANPPAGQAWATCEKTYFDS